MGKSRASSSGGGTAPTPPKDKEDKEKQKLIDQNNKLYDKITKRLGSGKKAILNEVLDYCNENGLEILDTLNNPTSNTRLEGTVARMSVFDPESGQTYNFHDTVLSGQHCFMPSEVKSALNRARSTFKEIQNDINPEIRSNVDSINFIGRHTLGRYHWDEHNIELAPYAFRGSPPQWETGLKGTMLHEMIHNWEYTHYGGTGAIRTFSTVAPTHYASTHPSESITTTCEQVYTKTLRNDARMPSGESVSSDYIRKHGKRGTPEQLYEHWEKGWKPQVNRAKEIMGLEKEES